MGCGDGLGPYCSVRVLNSKGWLLLIYKRRNMNPSLAWHCDDNLQMEGPTFTNKIFVYWYSP